MISHINGLNSKIYSIDAENVLTKEETSCLHDKSSIENKIVGEIPQHSKRICTENQHHS